MQHTYWSSSSPGTGTGALGPQPSAGSGTGGTGGPAPATGGPPPTGAGAPPTGAVGGGVPPVAPVGGGGVSLIRVRSITGTGPGAAGETSISDKESGPGWAAGGRGWLCQGGLPLARERQIILNVVALGCSIKDACEQIHKRS